MKEFQLRYFFVLCLTVTFKQALTTAEISSTVKDDKLSPILEGWQKFENKVKYLTNKHLVPIIVKNFGGMNVSDECMKNIKHLIMGMEEIKPWAMKFIDSSGKFFDGVLEGSFSSFGHYDECVDIEVKNKDFEDELLFRGQYCTIMMHPPVPPRPNFMVMHKIPEELKNFSQRDTAVAELSKSIRLFYMTPLRLGVCIPSRCSVHDVNKMAQMLGRELSLEATASRCEMKINRTFTPSAIFVIILYSFFLFLLLAGSAVDIYYSNNVSANLIIRILRAFSFFTNYRRLISPAPKSNTFNCLFGVRFLGAVWIILGHGYVLIIGALTHGLKESDRLMELFTVQFTVNASLCVDTFLFIGGMLVCYGTFHMCKHQNYKFSVFVFIIHRIWRILPSYLFILMSIFLMHMFGSGPIWHDMMDPTLESCRKNWWANILFIQNFYDTDTPCFVHFWYVAVDFQLYVFALVILVPLLKWPKIGVCLAVMTIIASALYAGIFTYIHELPPTLLFTVLDLTKIISLCFQRYFKPFVHAGPYAIGLLSGFFLYTKQKIKIPKVVLVIGWSLAFVLTFSVLQGTLPWYRDEDVSIATNIAYVSLNRIAWTLGIAWMIICCATGNGGIINYLLSLRVFVPLGRISYLAYLIHFPLQYVFIGNIRTRIQVDPFFIGWIFFGHVVVSFGFAFIVNMLVEAPFSNLEKICFSKRGQNDENSKITKEQNTFTMGVKSERNGHISEKNEDIAPIPAIHVQDGAHVENTEHSSSFPQCKLLIIK